MSSFHAQVNLISQMIFYKMCACRQCIQISVHEFCIIMSDDGNFRISKTLKMEAKVSAFRLSLITIFRQAYIYREFWQVKNTQSIFDWKPYYLAVFEKSFDLKSYSAVEHKISDLLNQKIMAFDEKRNEIVWLERNFFFWGEGGDWFRIRFTCREVRSEILQNPKQQFRQEFT